MGVTGETCPRIFHLIQRYIGISNNGKTEKANISDDAGLVEMLIENIDYF
jgi:hypothetical protein